jgi:predicted nucleic acid-binding Zn ribbon protein
LDTVEVEHPVGDPHPTNHDDCGGELGRIFDSQADVIFKTTGFTRTDKRFEPNPADL